MKRWVARLSLIALEADGEGAETHEVGFTVTGSGPSVVPLNTALEHARWYLQSSGFPCSDMAIKADELADMSEYALRHWL